MEPTTGLLLLSLLIGGATTGYVAASANTRAYGVTRGVTGAVRSGWTSGRGTASSAFSRPPSASSSGSSLGQDLRWALRQLWGGVHVVGTFFGALRTGYRTSADAATNRHAERRQRRGDRSRIRQLYDWLVPHVTGVEEVDTTGTRPTADEPTTATGRTSRKDRLMQVLADLRGFALVPFRRLSGRRRAVDYQPAPPEEAAPTPTDPATAGQNGANMTATVDIPGLAVVQEFSGPGAMEEPLVDLTQLNGRIADAMRHLVEGLHDFINAYAEANFATEALTAAVGALIEAIDDNGLINPITLAELLPAVQEAIDDAKGLGEAGSQLGAEGDIQAFEGQ
jgi:hypothetical protein